MMIKRTEPAELITHEHVVPQGSKLENSERELEAAMVAEVEAFFKQAEILKRILRHREFQDAGYKSFDEYMNDRQPFGIKRRRAWQLLAAKEVRSQLPDFDCTSGAVWTERSIRPLTYKGFTPNDHRRIGKKIAKRVANGEKLTANLVGQLCDVDRGIPEKRRKEKEQDRKDLQERLEVMEAKREAEFQAATPDGIADTISGQIFGWNSSFEEMDEHILANLSKVKADYLFHIIDRFKATLKNKIKMSPIKREPIEV